jgi:hypothetical protein
MYAKPAEVAWHIMYVREHARGLGGESKSRNLINSSSHPGSSIFSIQEQRTAGTRLLKSGTTSEVGFLPWPTDDKHK